MPLYTGTSISVNQIIEVELFDPELSAVKKFFINISKLPSIDLVLNYTPAPTPPNYENSDRLFSSDKESFHRGLL